MKIVARILIVSMVVNGFFSPVMYCWQCPPLSDLVYEMCQREYEDVKQGLAMVAKDAKIQRNVEELYLPAIPPIAREKIISLQKMLDVISANYRLIPRWTPEVSEKLTKSQIAQEDPFRLKISEIIEGYVGMPISQPEEVRLISMLENEKYGDWMRADIAKRREILLGKRAALHSFLRLDENPYKAVGRH